MSAHFLICSLIQPTVIFTGYCLLQTIRLFIFCDISRAQGQSPVQCRLPVSGFLCLPRCLLRCPFRLIDQATNCRFTVAQISESIIKVVYCRLNDVSVEFFNSSLSLSAPLARTHTHKQLISN